MTLSSEIKTVPVDLGSRRYDIIIGNNILSRTSTYIHPLLKTPRVAIVTDETVMALHGHRVEASLTQAGIKPHFIIRPAGESQKSFDGLQAVLNGLFDLAFDRQDIVIAFGGGVIGDLTGFAASVFKRGCRFIQIPTTLLAQVDSSVGGKTAINSPHGKNLIGAFYQPALVLADTEILSTLPERELKAGYAEVLKYGLLGDAQFFTWLETHGKKVLKLDAAHISHAVSISCQTKARIVAADEYERGQRALLNLGHTFGHALELEAGYKGDLLHGEAVSAGMVMAFEYSAQHGLCPTDDVARLSRHLTDMALCQPGDLKHLLQSPDRLSAHMDQDKKNEAGGLTLILPRKIGDAFVQKNTPRDSVRAYLNTCLLKEAHA